jgi:molybdate transport system regulatory protein
MGSRTNGLKQKRERHCANDVVGVVKAAFKVFLVKRGVKFNPYCGPGMINLLLEIDKCKSVRHACKNLELSYSKAWKLLDRFEEWLGVPACIGQQGGATGGSSELSKEGRDFITRYQSFTDECVKAVQSVAARYWNET